MLNISLQEILIILVIALLVVGPERLPDLARSIGKGLREIRRAQDEVKRTIQVNLDDEPPNGGKRSPAGGVDRAPTSSRADNASTGSTRVSEPTPTASDPTPIASEPLAASEMREISRTLGRGLAEIRRAREEVQRSFRVDLNRPSPRPAPSPAPGAAPTSSRHEPLTPDESATANDRSASADEAGDTEAPEGRTAN